MADLLVVDKHINVSILELAVADLLLCFVATEQIGLQSMAFGRRVLGPDLL